MARKIMKAFPETLFSDEIIKECYTVDRDSNGSVRSVVPMKSVFDFIKNQAMEDDGITVELIGENIIFIKGKKDDISTR